jgi:hypothetical protein
MDKLYRPSAAPSGADRREERHSVSLPGSIRQSVNRSQAIITDISAHGCCISGYIGPVSLNAPVHIRPEGLEPMLAWVRWSRGGVIGCEFARGLYGPVLDFLLARHGCPVELDARAA